MDLGSKRILCATDFSGYSTSAFHYALAVANWFGAEVAVVHVHQLPVRIAAVTVPIEAESAESTASSEIERDVLADNLRVFVHTEACGRCDVTWHLDESVHVAETIVSRASAMHANLIVLGTHGRSRLPRLILGSVTERVLRIARTPVFVVPPMAPRIPATPLPLHRILCATDFSRASGRALCCAVALGKRADAQVTVAHIVELPELVPELAAIDLSAYRKARFEHAEAALSAELERQVNGIAIDKLILAGRPGRELLRLTQEQQPDVLVMGVEGRGATDLILFGSVTQHVMRRASCPILTVPGDSSPLAARLS